MNGSGHKVARMHADCRNIVGRFCLDYIDLAYRGAYRRRSADIAKWQRGVAQGDA